MTKKDLTICEYSVKGLQRNRLDMEHDQENLLHNQFHEAISAAIESLDSEEGLVDREGSGDFCGPTVVLTGPCGPVDLANKGVWKSCT